MKFGYGNGKFHHFWKSILSYHVCIKLFTKDRWNEKRWLKFLKIMICLELKCIAIVVWESQEYKAPCYSSCDLSFHRIQSKYFKLRVTEALEVRQTKNAIVLLTLCDIRWKVGKLGPRLFLFPAALELLRSHVISFRRSAENNFWRGGRIEISREVRAVCERLFPQRIQWGWSSSEQKNLRFQPGPYQQ